jgi:hypothetical protein
MSVPSRSTLAVRREWLGGSCFEVCLRSPNAAGELTEAEPWIARALRDHGASAMLALLSESIEPLSSWRRRITQSRRRLARQGNVCARLDETLGAALAAAGIPQRVGVFVPRSGSAPDGATRLGLAASLAVLGHRSGPLFLPGRRVDASLIALADTLLVFPDDAAAGAGRSDSPRA